MLNFILKPILVFHMKFPHQVIHFPVEFLLGIMFLIVQFSQLIIFSIFVELYGSQSQVGNF